MPRLILIQEDDWEDQYRESMNYLNSKYHDQPTKLRNIPFVEGEEGALQPPRGRRAPVAGRTPNGKVII